MDSLILAGGRSLRLGKNKALTMVGGTNLLERVSARLKSVSERILVVTSQEDYPLLSASYQGKIIVDEYACRGSLGGVYTGLLAAESPFTLVVACDMPFLNVELLRYITLLSSGFDAVVPRLLNGDIEPLHAVYSRNRLDIMKKMLETRDWSLNSLLSKLNVLYISEEECRRFDPDLLSFLNINNQKDLEKAEQVAARL